MKVLFVCVGNSCRSQMAEGWARHLGMVAGSAGSHPAEEVNPLAIQVMEEIGIDLAGQRPEHVDDFDAGAWNLIISMGCGVACPMLPIDQDWGLEDPVDQPIEMFRTIRDRIGELVRDLLDTH